jgi:hypothetical protein
MSVLPNAYALQRGPITMRQENEVSQPRSFACPVGSSGPFDY